MSIEIAKKVDSELQCYKVGCINNKQDNFQLKIIFKIFKFHMLKAILKKIFSTSDNKLLKKTKKDLEKINSFEETISFLNDEELRLKTRYFKNLLQEGKTLEDILHEAFAVVREASKRTLKLRHFDVQMQGGIALYNNKIAEMFTGEGKTLVVTTAAYLRALEGKGMHIVTVNDYLAKRDAESMGQIFKFLDMSVGCITSITSHEERTNAYKCDITYATNHELGFDYLRDNMQFEMESKVQRPLYAACVDEADSVLIDEARVPLVLSDVNAQNTNIWHVINNIILSLKIEDYVIDKELNSVSLTELGNQHAEALLKKYNLLSAKANLYDIENTHLVHQISQSLRAHKLMHKDIDYIVKNDQIILIQKSTGRVGLGRRFSNNLHQALEAKEQVTIQKENEEIASISFQNYFLLYKFLSGMTGTASTEKVEFKQIYGLDIVTIPPNQKVQRIDYDDAIYGTMKEKESAVINLIIERYNAGQPVLVGTESVQESERFSYLLSKKKISHKLLNAKNHEQEAYVIAQAGCYKNITIATNIAGRGTDILLGGNPKMLFQQQNILNSNLDNNKLEELQKKISEECKLNKEKVIAAGGLFVIGTTRNESRRIDNQLRGRSGRQGDIGYSQFFLSLDDNLVRIFTSEKMAGFLKSLALKDNEAIKHPTINKVIETAQRKIEAQHYDMRKRLFEFDNVLNEQRKIVYSQRDLIMQTEDIRSVIFDVVNEIIESLFAQANIKKFASNNQDLMHLVNNWQEIFSFHLPQSFITDNNINNAKSLKDYLTKCSYQQYLFTEEKEILDYHDSVAKYILLKTIDEAWQAHINALGHIKEAIHNRAYAQQNPLQEYKKEALNLFEEMLNKCNLLFIKRLYTLVQENAASMQGTNQELDGNAQLMNDEIELQGKQRRNEPCYCNSGKKYKKCHGVL